MTSPAPSARDGLIPLAAAPAAVLKFAGTKDPADVARCSYRLIWAAASNGMIRADRVGGRWFVRQSELPTIAEALGLKPPAAAKRTRAPSNAAAV